MAKFRSRPVEIEAYQLTRSIIEGNLFDGVPLPFGLSLLSSEYHRGRRDISRAEFYVVTIHGQKTLVAEGDWIITEPDGIHHYPCKPDVFEAKYYSVSGVNMATKNKPGAYDCYANAEPNEPMFVLLGRDPLGSQLVAAWVALRANDLQGALQIIWQAHQQLQDCHKAVLPYGSDKSREAQACRSAMYKWWLAKRLEQIEARLKSEET